MGMPVLLVSVVLLGKIWSKLCFVLLTCLGIFGPKAFSDNDSF